MPNQKHFAVKELTGKDKVRCKDFLNERDQLNRFNGRIHPHLVTLLATYEMNNSYNFIFPLALCSLDDYWEDRVRSLGMSKANVIWFADQLRGLVGAVDTIHNPAHLSLPVEKYGRHGDIKPDNILCCPSTRYRPNAMLVITDMGLSALNSNKSRSNILGESVPPVPGYRPPECDVDGGSISRAFDIWTLGCLFLEMVAWFVGGWELKEKFVKRRMTTNILTGSEQNILYNLREGTDKNTYVQFVKPEVTEVWSQLYPFLQNICVWSGVRVSVSQRLLRPY
jgi:serine/threonine protein kinase